MEIAFSETFVKRKNEVLLSRAGFTLPDKNQVPTGRTYNPLYIWGVIRERGINDSTLVLSKSRLKSSTDYYYKSRHNV